MHYKKKKKKKLFLLINNHNYNYTNISYYTSYGCLRKILSFIIIIYIWPLSALSKVSLLDVPMNVFVILQGKKTLSTSHFIVKSLNNGNIWDL